MPRIIMPVFSTFPVEGAIIGRLLAGYGDLEFDLCNCIGMAIDDMDMVLKAMFRARGEHQRILIADAIGRKPYRAFSLETQFSETIAGMQHCRKIRNEFAHCNFFDDNSGSLAYLNLETNAKSNAVVRSIRTFTVHHLTAPFLQQKEEYFGYISDCLAFLNHEAQRLAGRAASNAFAMPPKMSPPPLRGP